MGEHRATPGNSSGVVKARGLHGPPAAWGALAFLAICNRTLSVHAAELEVRGPEACSDREELVFRVSRALGGRLESVPNLGFVVNVAAAPGGFEALLNITDDEQGGLPSERRITGSDCPQLMDALSVIMVLAIHRVQGATQASDDGPARTEAATHDATPDSPVTPPDASGDVGAESAPVEIEPAVSAWLVGDVGALPNPGLGLALSIDLTSGALRLQGSGTLFLEQQALLEGEEVPAPGADLSLALGAISGCYAPGGSWQSGLVFGACLRAEAGRLSGRGTDVRDPRSDGRWWLAPGVDVLRSWNIEPTLRLGVQAGATVPLSRTQFRLGELGDLYRPATVTFRVALGVGVVFR